MVHDDIDRILQEIFPQQSDLFWGVSDGVHWFTSYGTDDPVVALGSRGEQWVLGEPHLVWRSHTDIRWEAKARFELPPDWSLSESSLLQKEARAIARRRRKRYRRCGTCQERLIPESGSPFHGTWTCHGCMADQGVVF